MILQGDCIERMAELPEQSVHCCVTSPPYWSLRDYGVEGQYGLEDTPEAYIEQMAKVFRGVWRVLRDDGTLWINIGDSYASGTNNKESNRRDRVECVPVGRAMPHGLKPKDLVGIPWMLATALRSAGAADWKAVQVLERVMQGFVEEYADETIPDRVLAVLERLGAEWRQAKGDSWYLRQEIIWHKPNPMPESTRDRCTKAHESIFLLAKRGRYYFDQDAIREPNTTGRPLSTDVANGAMRSSDLETFGLTRGKSNKSCCHPGGANKRSVWTVATAPYAKAHFATFPPKLIEPCILAGTSAKGCCPECGAPWERIVERTLNPNGLKNGGHREPGRDSGLTERTKGDKAFNASGKTGEPVTTGWTPTCDHNLDPIPCTVLDPFAGSGTTAQVAREHGRNYILCELKAEYVQLIKERLKGVQPPLFGC